MAINTNDIWLVIHHFKQYQYRLTTDLLVKPKQIVKFAEEHENSLKGFDSYDLMKCLDKELEFNSYFIQDYFKENFGFQKIADEIAVKFDDFLKEAKELKNDVSEMQEFLSEMYYSGKSFSWFVAGIGHITKKTSNKDLNGLKETFLPYKDYLIDGCINILNLDKFDIEMVKKAFDILELDNQTIKDNL